MVVINELLLEVSCYGYPLPLVWCDFLFPLQIGSVQAFDMRSYLDLLMHLLLMQDTFQRHRLISCLKGELSFV